MKITVLANDTAYNELVAANETIQWEKAGSIDELLATDDAVALFNLLENAAAQDYKKTKLPVFINSVVYTLKEKNHTSTVVRINGWNGFLNRTNWEISGDISLPHQEVLKAINKKYTVLPDEPGFIAARVIAMIINEAFYAKGENVSTEDEIDIAMKLGTNYPKGPFEWKREIGVKNIYELLSVLSKSDKRYIPSPLLQLEAIA